MPRGHIHNYAEVYFARLTDYVHVKPGDTLDHARLEVLNEATVILGSISNCRCSDGVLKQRNLTSLPLMLVSVV